MILLSEKAIKSHQSINSQGHSGIVQFTSKQRWLTGSRSQKFAIVISPLIEIWKRKSWNGLKFKQISASQLHVQTFGTIVK
jgi:hypothetical protein